MTFPSDNGNPKDLSKTAKFAISFEVRDAISSSHTDFTGNDAIPKPKTADFNNLLPAGTIVPFGAKLRDISESFNIDDSEDGSGTFTHSINFSLMPAPALVPAAGAPIRPDSTYFRNNAGALVNSLTVYSTFVQLTSLLKSLIRNSINIFSPRMKHFLTLSLLICLISPIPSLEQKVSIKITPLNRLPLTRTILWSTKKVS